MHKILLPTLATALLVSACTWVPLEPGAEKVLVLPESRLTPDCVSLGKVTVSVADRVGALERHADEIEEDLQALARNHAAGKQADTVVPAGPVDAGRQTFDVYRCEKPEEMPRAERQRDDRDEPVEVLPYGD